MRISLLDRLTRFAIHGKRPRWQVEKEAIGLSRVQPVRRPPRIHGTKGVIVDLATRSTNEMKQFKVFKLLQ